MNRLKKYMEYHGDSEYDDLMAHFEEEEWTDNLGALHEDYEEGPGEALCINGLELEEEDELRLNQRIVDVLTGKDVSEMCKDELVHGYTRNCEAEFGIIIPFALSDLIVRLFPHPET